MFGSILSSVVKIATLPLDVADAGMDVLAGGDGSKRSRRQNDSPLGMLTEMRDGVTRAIEEIDD